MSLDSIPLTSVGWSYIWLTVECWYSAFTIKYIYLKMAAVKSLELETQLAEQKTKCKNTFKFKVASVSQDSHHRLWSIMNISCLTSKLRRHPNIHIYKLSILQICRTYQTVHWILSSPLLPMPAICWPMAQGALNATHLTVTIPRQWLENLHCWGKLSNQDPLPL